MFKIIILNVLLFVLCIVLFILMAFGIGYAMGTASHTLETGAAYVAVVILHLYLNHRLLKKAQLDTSKHGTVSTLLIIGAYILYLFIFK